MITIFTPTYNRAYILPNLYESLKRQTSFDFEWLVVDDGSVDNTEELLKEWMSEPSFSIRYIKQENGGKHRAINRGVKEAKGELFFIVDSDDFLVDFAIEEILKQYALVKDETNVAGICGMKIYPNGERVGGNVDFKSIYCSLFDFRYKHGVYGDIAEVYKTSVLAQFPFPDIPNEKFCSEALVWYAIAKKWKIHFFNVGIYICDYLDDGLTINSLTHRINSPIYAMMTYWEVLHSPIPLMKRLKAAISFWRFYFHSPKSKRFFDKSILLFCPLGYCIYLNDKRKL